MAFRKKNSVISTNIEKVDTIIGKGTVFQGTINANGTVRIEGEYKGEIRAKGDVIIGNDGRVEATVEARNVVVAGQMCIRDRHSILLAKSALDGITAIVFSSSMGIGVIFSALPVLIYQGLLTLLAESVQGILTDPVVREMTATGGLLIVAIGVNMLGFNKFKRCV